MTKKKSFWDDPEHIIIAEDMRGRREDCDCCPDEACIKIGILGLNRTRLMINLCSSCRLELEATLRRFRKWSIRGGKLA